MSSLDNLYALLRPLRLYALHRNSLIDCELYAYGAAFAIIEEQLRELRADSFPQSATGEALAMHEQAVGLPVREGVSLSARRNLIMQRLSGQYPPTVAGMEAALAACGLISPQIEEAGRELMVSALGIAPGMTAEECWRLALQILPAHLSASPAGASWDRAEALGKSWDELDAAARSWTEIALCGAT